MVLTNMFKDRQGGWWKVLTNISHDGQDGGTTGRPKARVSKFPRQRAAKKRKNSKPKSVSSQTSTGIARAQRNRSAGISGEQSPGASMTADQLRASLELTPARRKAAAEDLEADKNKYLA